MPEGGRYGASRYKRAGRRLSEANAQRKWRKRDKPDIEAEGMYVRGTGEDMELVNIPELEAEGLYVRGSGEDMELAEYPALEADPLYVRRTGRGMELSEEPALRTPPIYMQQTPEGVEMSEFEPGSEENPLWAEGMTIKTPRRMPRKDMPMAPEGGEWWSKHVAYMPKEAPPGTGPAIGVIPSAMFPKEIAAREGDPAIGVDMTNMSDEDRLKVWDMLSPEDRQYLLDAWNAELEQQG